MRRRSEMQACGMRSASARKAGVESRAMARGNECARPAIVFKRGALAQYRRGAAKEAHVVPEIWGSRLRDPTRADVSAMHLVGKLHARYCTC